MVITRQQTQKNRLTTELAFEGFDEIKLKIKRKAMINVSNNKRVL